VIGCGLDDLEFVFWKGRRFFFLPKCPDWFWGPFSHLFNGYWDCFLGVKPPGHEVDHSPPSRAEVKN
jgi:hypothetical protein